MQEEEKVAGFAEKISSKWQFLLDKSSPHILVRWITFLVSLYLYLLRVYLVDGWYIVTYGLGIFLLSQSIGFLSPQFDPEDDSDMDLGLPTSNSDEFRPFARRLPEFKFWYQCIKAVWIAFVMTFFSVFDVAVFWPILALYFCVLFFLTMKRQIRHMIKYKYLPFSWGKAKYQGKAAVKESK